MVTNDGLREPSVGEYKEENEVCSVFSRSVRCCWPCLNPSIETVLEDKDAVTPFAIPLSWRERSNEVHGEVSTRGDGHFWLVKESGRKLCRFLVALAGVAGFDKFLDIC